MRRDLKLYVVAAVAYLGVAAGAYAQQVAFDFDRPVARRAEVVALRDGGAGATACGGFERADGGAGFRVCTDEIDLAGAARSCVLGVLSSPAVNAAMRQAALRRLQSEAD